MRSYLYEALMLPVLRTLTPGPGAPMIVFQPPSKML